MCSDEFAASLQKRTIAGSFARKGLPTARLAEHGLRENVAIDPLMLADMAGERPATVKRQRRYSDLKCSLKSAPCSGRGGCGRRSIVSIRMKAA
jgi:hypothetical protein